MEPNLQAAESKPPDIGLSGLENQAKVLKITTELEYQLAGSLLVSMAKAQKRWNAYWSAPLQAAKDALTAAKESYDTIREKRDVAIVKLQVVRQMYEREMTAYHHRARENHNRLQEAVTIAAQESQASLKNKAMKLAHEGKLAEARTILAQSQMMATPPIVESPNLKLEGVPQVEDIDVTVTDYMALVKAVADGVIASHGKVMGKEYPVLEVHDSVLKEMAKAAGDNFHCPGVTISKRISFRPRGTD